MNRGTGENGKALAGLDLPFRTKRLPCGLLLSCLLLNLRCPLRVLLSEGMRSGTEPRFGAVFIEQGSS